MEESVPSVSAPQYVARPAQMMGFTNAVKNCIKNNYIGFSGRASRSEFWWFTLFGNLVPIVGYIVVFGYISVALGGEGATMTLDTLYTLLMLPSLVSLPILLPGLSVSVRRMHDTGRSGWMLLIGIIPCIGIIFLLVWLIDAGNAHANAYGDVPTNVVE